MVDDASPDVDPAALESMIEPLRARVPITLSRNEHNLGMVGNWNRAVAAGHGELTMLVSQDDELGAGMLAAYTAEFAADPTVVLVSGAEEFIDEESRPLPRKLSVGHRHNVFVHRDRYVLDHAELVRLSLRNGQGFGEPSAVMFRRVGVRSGRWLRPRVRARRRRRFQPPGLGPRAIGLPPAPVSAEALARGRAHPHEHGLRCARARPGAPLRAPP